MAILLYGILILLGATLAITVVAWVRYVPLIVRIFGETREFLTGTLQVALRCRATICPAFVVSRPNFYFHLIVLPPIHTPAEDQLVENPERIAELMQKYADGIEQHVREHPDHLSRA